MEVTDPSDAVKGIEIRFMHDHGEGTVYWLEGTIEQMITKLTMAKKLKYTENFFRIGKIRVINTWGMIPNPIQKQFSPILLEP